MEKFFILLFVSILAFVGYACYHEQTSENLDMNVREFVYNGHSYLYFKKGSNYGSTVLHDPDCKNSNHFK